MENLRNLPLTILGLHCDSVEFAIAQDGDSNVLSIDTMRVSLTDTQLAVLEQLLVNWNSNKEI